MKGTTRTTTNTTLLADNNGVSHTGRLTPLLSICPLFTFSSPSVTFMAWPQADLDVDIWMELPTGIVVSGKTMSQGHTFSN